MPRSSWSVQDAKNRFSEVVTAAQREPQTVTKHGKPAVVMVDASAFERLKKRARAKRPTLAEILLAIPKGGEEFERAALEMREFDF